MIKKFRPESFQKGNIYDIKGRLVGTHEGIINYTIGQRKGIKIADKEALYVVKINADKNSIVVGPKSSLLINSIELRDLNILGRKKEFEKAILIKVRSTGKLLKAKIYIKNDNSAFVEMLEEESGISPGQACVFYSKDEFGDKVLGGGWISATNNKNLST